ncbi:MAG: phosphatase PAP2 family protein [Candidatus Doudnabacteria bacterium]
MYNLDYKIFFSINGLAGKNQVLDIVGIFLGVWLIYFLAGWVLILLFYKRYFWNSILAIISSLVARLLIVEVIKRLVNRPRPYEIFPVHQIVSDTEKGLSFSSGHAVILFCIAFSFYGTKLFYPLLVLATVASVARIFIGVHYPSDVLASMVIALATVLFFRRLLKKRFLS